jgi:hypothetical protein
MNSLSLFDRLKDHLAKNRRTDLSGRTSRGTVMSALYKYVDTRRNQFGIPAELSVHAFDLSVPSLFPGWDEEKGGDLPLLLMTGCFFRYLFGTAVNHSVTGATLFKRFDKFVSLGHCVLLGPDVDSPTFLACRRKVSGYDATGNMSVEDFHTHDLCLSGTGETHHLYAPLVVRLVPDCFKRDTYSIDKVLGRLGFDPEGVCSPSETLCLADYPSYTLQLKESPDAPLDTTMIRSWFGKPLDSQESLGVWNQFGNALYPEGDEIPTENKVQSECSAARTHVADAGSVAVTVTRNPSGYAVPSPPDAPEERMADGKSAWRIGTLMMGCRMDSNSHSIDLRIMLPRNVPIAEIVWADNILEKLIDIKQLLKVMRESIRSPSSVPAFKMAKRGPSA